jgi:hypothetical protein
MNDNDPPSSTTRRRGRPAWNKGWILPSAPWIAHSRSGRCSSLDSQGAVAGACARWACCCLAAPAFWWVWLLCAWGVYATVERLPKPQDVTPFASAVLTAERNYRRACNRYTSFNRSRFSLSKSLLALLLAAASPAPVGQLNAQPLLVGMSRSISRSGFPGPGAPGSAACVATAIANRRIACVAQGFGHVTTCCAALLGLSQGPSPSTPHPARPCPEPLPSNLYRVF